MTAVGGGLYLLDRSPASRLDGVSLPALLAPGGNASVDAVYKTQRPLDRARWRAIVINHSGTANGKPEALDAAARSSGLRELGFHFVIGNGNGMSDGELFVGRRWRDQAPGAHVAGDSGEWYNQHAIAICVVGNGDRNALTEAQMDRLLELTASLCRRLGIPADQVYLHRELAPVSSPGRLFPAVGFREELAARL